MLQDCAYVGSAHSTCSPSVISTGFLLSTTHRADGLQYSSHVIKIRQKLHAQNISFEHKGLKGGRGPST